MLQKIIQVGNSLAITLPAEYVRKAKLKAGNQIELETNIEHHFVLMRDGSTETAKELTPEFFHWLKSTTKKYKSLIQELSTK